GKLLRHHADALQDQTGKSADTEFEALEIIARVDLLADTAAHLRAGISGGKADAVVVIEQTVEQLLAAAVADPGDHLPRVQPERQRRAEREGWILAEVVVHRGIAHFDGAALYGVEHLQTRNDLAGGKDQNLELVVGDSATRLAKDSQSP